jgi:hypothetical protein
LMLQVHDQMMIDMFLRPLLPLLLGFFGYIVIQLVCCSMIQKGVVRQQDSQWVFLSPINDCHVSLWSMITNVRRMAVLSSNPLIWEQMGFLLTK